MYFHAVISNGYRTPFETFDFNKEELIDKQFENDDMPF